MTPEQENILWLTFLVLAVIAPISFFHWLIQEPPRDYSNLQPAVEWALLPENRGF